MTKFQGFVPQYNRNVKAAEGKIFSMGAVVIALYIVVLALLVLA